MNHSSGLRWIRHVEWVGCGRHNFFPRTP